jgi:hypothetical protein
VIFLNHNPYIFSNRSEAYCTFAPYKLAQITFCDIIDHAENNSKRRTGCHY